jgi:hypothetical protein
MKTSLSLFNLLDLKVENEKLKDYIKDLEAQLNDLSLKLKDSQELTEILTIINEQFGKENDDLYRRLSVYEKLRKPRIMEERQNFKRKHARYHINFKSWFKLSI